MRSSRSIILAPMTVGVVWTSCFLYVAVLFLVDDHSNSRNPQSEAQRDLGATVFLVQYNQITSKNGKVEQIPLFAGPFDLWDGQLWRVPINAFHHVGLLHLLMNGCAMLYMGKLLEPRLGKLRTL
ncbi:MAG TPA: rhomboid family intramembrane serine protease, partial [Planctomycetaceae bacterium]|nr:rhomboid family intramembrane serine protease [Planctomycetaceae bacterium]